MNISQGELVLGFGLLVLAVLLWWRLPRRTVGDQPDGSMLLLQNQLNELVRANSDLGRLIDSRLSDSSKLVNESLRLHSTESGRLIREVSVEMAKIGETNKQVVGFTEQLRSLQDMLKNPKQRGILGEYYLETLLKNVLPVGSYQMQYAFRDGTIVDAMVRVRDKIIPIDSKFSLENYNRLVEETNPAERERLEKLFKSDLKNRIDETSKYIKPEEGTMDFAFMFIPHEAIYYDLLVAQVGAIKINTRDLVEYAFKDKRVIIVSPTSFLAYLQTVLQGLKALQIEESAKEIGRKVEELARHLSAYDQYMSKLGVTLGTTVGHYNEAYKKFRSIDKDITKITGTPIGIEPTLLDRPNEAGE
ncbi:MAG: DNA recombination protein RmuC [Patescibacteria group bacterium]